MPGWKEFQNHYATQFLETIPLNENELNQDEVYEWFLSDVFEKTNNGKRTLVLHWSNKDANVIARESFVLLSDVKQSRVYGLMLTLGYQPNDDTQPDPAKFFVKSMRITARPLKYYAEHNSEKWKWKLYYPSIKPLDVNITTISEKERDRLVQLASRQDNYQEAMKKVASINPDWMPVFLHLVEKGELSW
jgi:hypothetical protein